MDFEINAPLGSRIIFNLEAFDSAKVAKQDKNDANHCKDFVIVKLNKTLSTADSLYAANLNPKFCNVIHKPKQFITYSNKLLVSIFFDQLLFGDKQIAVPSFNFSYTSEPICNNVYTKFNSSMISYNSIKSISELDEKSNECLNEIKLNKYRRVVLYKIDWLRNKNAHYDEFDDEVVASSQFINGKSACQDSDSLIISQDNPKYSKYALSNGDHVYNTFCMNNPFSALISRTNNVFLSFRRLHATKPNLKHPLSFEIGYFSYRHLYTGLDSVMIVDFSEIIPKNVNEHLRVDYLDFKIKLPNADNYVMPVISDCFTNTHTGKLISFLKYCEFFLGFNL